MFWKFGAIQVKPNCNGTLDVECNGELDREIYWLDELSLNERISMTRDELMFIIANFPWNVMSNIWKTLWDEIKEIINIYRITSYEKDLFLVLGDFDEFTKSCDNTELLKKLNQFKYRTQSDLYITLCDGYIEIDGIQITLSEWAYITVFSEKYNQ